MKNILLLTLLLTALIGQSIDANKSYVKFKVRNMEIRDVHGTITDMQGTVKFDEQKIDSSYFNITVNVNTIDTKSEKRDKHLLNEDFFETDKWQTIRFKSNNIEKRESDYLVTGELTIKDVTKIVSVPFNIEETDSTITFNGGDIVNRLDYNVGVEYNNFKIRYELNVEVFCVYNK